MESQNMLKLAKKNLKSAILIGLLFGAVSFLGLILSQKNFKASADILVVQNQELSTDYYAMSRSADYLANILSQAVYSEKFLNEVILTGKVSSVIFPSDLLERKKAWEKMVKIQKSSSTSILTVQVFGDTASQAKSISDGVVDVLINKNSIFLGTNQNLKVQVLSGSIIEKNPSVAQIVVASVGGFIIGIIFTLLIVFYYAEFAKEEEINEEINIDTSKNEDYLAEDSDYWRERINKELS